MAPRKKQGAEARVPSEVMAIKVSSIRDIARLAASSITLGQMTYLVRFRVDGKKIIGSLAVFRDYYNMYGIPLFYYTECDDRECEERHYVSFKIDETGEKLSFTDKNIPGTIMIPIVEFSEVPSFISLEG